MQIQQIQGNSNFTKMINQRRLNMQHFHDLIAAYIDPDVDLKRPLIFLSGAMTGLTYQERSGWRDELADYINEHEGAFRIADPTMFDAENKDAEYQKKAENYDMESIVNCRFFVINLDYQSSVGTAQEIMFAWLCGKEIIGIKTNDEELHPWFANKLGVMFNSVEEAGEYLVNYKF